jgi:hypothetical protein
VFAGLSILTFEFPHFPRWFEAEMRESGTG